MAANESCPSEVDDTRILKTDPSSISVRHTPGLEDLEVTFSDGKGGLLNRENLAFASVALRLRNVPVAFPTETVYGLGADATRSSAVRGIYAAKRRPSDNPLIVHVCSLSQLRTLLAPTSSSSADAIPAIYRPLMERFWPGPLTILLPLSERSPRRLAPEVTAGLSTFGARMPSAPLALALLKACDLPLAAPSANASTRPSPTRADHVAHDLAGRIELILDGGPCEVGVESTVVDGLSDPPAVLRPGGVSLNDIRTCPGWENCVRGYKDHAEGGDDAKDAKGVKSANGVNGSGGENGAVNGDQAPRAPGMKYKHYSPTAKVALVKSGLLQEKESLRTLVENFVTADGNYKAIGILRAKHWQQISTADIATDGTVSTNAGQLQFHKSILEAGSSATSRSRCTVYDAQLGATAVEMARNLFHALRELDLLGVDLIIVEGLDDSAGDSDAAAVMNRLRKAAEIKINTLPWRLSSDN